MKKISTCIVFNDQAEEAVDFYTSVFKNSKKIGTTYCGENEPSGLQGSVRTISFELHGHHYLAVNGGPHFSFNDAVSLMVQCDTQEEIDEYWDKLTAEGGQSVQCGWLQDKFGFRWQIVPRILDEMMSDHDSKKTDRVMQALLKMVKLDIATLKRVYLEES